MVSNGNRLQYNSYCSNVPICLATTKFLIELYILPINGADVVLDIQRLKTLGPITTNYDSLTTQFTNLSNTIHLQGLRDDGIKKCHQVNSKECTIQNKFLPFILLNCLLLLNKCT